jgi:hypothetical protein
VEDAAVPLLEREQPRKERAHRELLDVTRVDAAEQRLRNQIDRRSAEPTTKERCNRFIAFR